MKNALHVATTLALLYLSFYVAAHEIKPAIVDLNYISNSDEKKLVIELVVNLESLMAGIEPTHDDTNDSQNSARYEQLRQLEKDALLDEFNRFQSQFLSSINITDAQGTRLKMGVHAMNIPSVHNTEIARDTRITLHSPLSDDAQALSWQWDKAFGEVIVRANSDLTELNFASLLAPGQTTELIQFTQNTEQSFTSVLVNYTKLGFIHILPKGLDHILFVLGLFLLSTQWRPLLLQVSTFTVAHSITLALSSMNLLSVPSSIVEPLIALSIVFVCVENFLVSSLGKWRIVTVFAFGLLHGLGFASVLQEVGLHSSNFISALLGFNLGVEIGQLVVIALALLTIGFWFGKKSWYQSHISRPASVVIGLVGLFWFVQRTLL